MTEALFTILGTVLGFILSELAQLRRENRNEKRQAQSVRALIGLEIDMNLRLLEEFWAQVNRADEQGENPSLRKRELARQFIEISLPEFEKRSFESQLHLLATSLHEQEVTQVFQCYERLSRLNMLRNSLAKAAKEQKDEWNLASGGNNFVPMDRALGLSHKFEKSAPAIWAECESVVAQLKAKGNPLKKGQKAG